jgi:hypothetical protein
MAFNMTSEEKDVPVTELTAQLYLETHAEAVMERLVASGLGTCADLPSDVRELADLAPDERVIAWTSYDPDHSGNLCTASCASTSYGPALEFCPCLWPMYCLELQASLQRPRETTQVYWILGEQNLYRVRKRLDNCFISGFCVVTEESTRTSLENITEGSIVRIPPTCYIESPEEIKLHVCDRSINSHISGACLKNQKIFLKEILKQRDLVVAAAPVSTTAATQTMDRGDDDQAPRSIRERLQLITQLLSEGLVSQEDYDRKKQEILELV